MPCLPLTKRGSGHKLLPSFKDIGAVILGIDAAWTAREPSGVALIGEQNGRWHLVAVAASYGQFTADGGSLARPQGSQADPSTLVAACVAQCGKRPDIVAIDMPLARSPITKRRESDNAVSREYAGRGAGTHTPSSVRPGPIGDELTSSFLDVGYLLLTRRIETPGLMETYPHPALIELTAQAKRLPTRRRRSAGIGPISPPLTGA